VFLEASFSLGKTADRGLYQTGRPWQGGGGKALRLYQTHLPDRQGDRKKMTKEGNLPSRTGARPRQGLQKKARRTAGKLAAQNIQQKEQAEAWMRIESMTSRLAGTVEKTAPKRFQREGGILLGKGRSFAPDSPKIVKPRGVVLGEKRAKRLGTTTSHGRNRPPNRLPFLIAACARKQLQGPGNVRGSGKGPFRKKKKSSCALRRGMKVILSFRSRSLQVTEGNPMKRISRQEKDGE